MTTSHEFAAEHDRLEPLVTDHALGTLEPAAHADVDAHLRACAACRATFDEVAAASADLELALAPGIMLQPRAGSTADLLELAAKADQHLGSDTAIPASPRRLPRRFRRWHAGAGLASAAVCGTVLVLGMMLLDSRERVGSLERRLKDARGDQVQVLKGASFDVDEAGPFSDARAKVVFKRDEGIVTFADVPAPPKGKVWQVWTIDSGTRIRSLGVIDSATPSAFLEIAKVDPEDIERIIVTIETAGDGTEPTAEDVPDATI